MFYQTSLPGGAAAGHESIVYTFTSSDPKAILRMRKHCLDVGEVAVD